MSSMIYNSEMLFIRNYIPDSNYMLLWCEYESYDNTDDIGIKKRGTFNEYTYRQNQAK